MRFLDYVRAETPLIATPGSSRGLRSSPFVTELPSLETAIEFAADAVDDHQLWEEARRWRLACLPTSSEIIEFESSFGQGFRDALKAHRT